MAWHGVAWRGVAMTRVVSARTWRAVRAVSATHAPRQRQLSLLRHDVIIVLLLLLLLLLLIMTMMLLDVLLTYL